MHTYLNEPRDLRTNLRLTPTTDEFTIFLNLPAGHSKKKIVQDYYNELVAGRVWFNGSLAIVYH